jgi:glucose/arabinose dehydrogenase
MINKIFFGRSLSGLTIPILFTGAPNSNMKKRFLIGSIFFALVSIPVWMVFFYRADISGISPSLFGTFPDIQASAPQGKLPLSYPEEFELSIFAEGLKGPRVIAFDPAGTMLVSLPPAGKIVALPDADGNGRADRIVEVVSGLNRPHGIAFSPDGGKRLYVAESNRVTAYDYDSEKFRAGSPEKLVDLPGGGNHTSRSILLLPPPNEETMLISVGSTCNSCEEEDWRRAKILVMRKGGAKLDTFASGLRNAVFMTVHPESKEIWATEMGRDFLGDDLPPDEINRIEPGNDYGWPYCYGDNIPDNEFLGDTDYSEACRGKTPALFNLQAHSAPLGLSFFPSRGWPSKYRNNLLVAYHGSWNRSKPTGYKVVLFRFDEQGRFQQQEDFISGWLRNEYSSIGRPVDIKIRETGHIFISDDKAGVIYRLALKKNPV